MIPARHRSCSGEGVGDVAMLLVDPVRGMGGGRESHFGPLISRACYITTAHLNYGPLSRHTAVRDSVCYLLFNRSCHDY